MQKFYQKLVRPRRSMKKLTEYPRSTWPRIYLENQLISNISHNNTAGRRCLNLGCGTTGRYASLLSNYDVDGVDIADVKSSSVPRKHHCCDAKELPFKDGTFDFAVAIVTFEHIEDNVCAMQELFRTIKPGCEVIVTTPTSATWLFEFGRHGPHYYSKKSLKRLAENAGFNIKQIAHCGGFVFYCSNLMKSWLSPIGVRVFRRRWFPIIDTLLIPLYAASLITDCFLLFPATNWVMVCEKPKV